MASFLLPDGYARPPLVAVLREGRVVGEAGRHVVRRVGDRRARLATAYTARTTPRHADPVVLVPGFLAGDLSLAFMARALRQRGFRTYRSHIHANIGCTMAAGTQLERRLESISARRGTPVQLVGHSLGGMIARGLAVRRPDLVSNVVTLGSPMLAPGAHHRALTTSVDLLVRLSRVGLSGLMSADCVAGSCAVQCFEESRRPLPAEVGFTAVYSRRDGVVDWRACVDPQAEAVEVQASHLGMALDPAVLDLVAERLALRTTASALEVDRGESA